MLSAARRALGGGSKSGGPQEARVVVDSEGDSFADCTEVGRGMRGWSWMGRYLLRRIQPCCHCRAAAPRQRRSRRHCAGASPPLTLQAHLHPDAHDEGGLACTNLELLEGQRR